MQQIEQLKTVNTIEYNLWL